MDIKNLSSHQVWWAQELSRYHFQINYYQGKANGATNAFSRFSQRSHEEKEKLWTKNTQIFHYLQTSLINASLSDLSLSSTVNFLPLHRVFICNMHILPQLHQFWDMFQAKLSDESLYQISIGVMYLKFLELEESDDKARKIRVERLKNNYEKVDGVLHHQRLLFVSKTIQTELISQHHNNLLIEYFDIDKIKDLVSWKYH